MDKPAPKAQEPDAYTDEEINELAEWLEDLTLRQAFFLKESYEQLLQLQAHEAGQAYVH